MKLSLPKHTKTVIKVISNGSLRNRDAITENGARSIEKEKEEFLKHGKLPKAGPKKCSTQDEKSRKKRHVRVSFEFLPEAKRILDLVNEKFENGDAYLDEVFGDSIEQSEASKYLIEYLQMQGLDGALRILWTKEINCCGRIIWTGPDARLNKPEKRRYSLWLKSTTENVFLRQQAIKGLADHEIGTHYLRMLNDGFQPWFSNRRLFGLRSLNSRHLKVTEEGFAAINTLLQLNSRLLWWPAFLYYTACMAIKMTFKQLFHHLETYIRDPDQRWKHVMRAKRDLDDYSGFGGTGKDQSYFTGAVRILRNAGDIDFKLLYSGKLCFDELKRVKRVSRASIKLPHFLDNIALYRFALKEMLYINGLQPMVILHSLRRKPIVQKEDTTRAVQRKRRTLLGSVKANKEKYLHREELDKLELFTDYGNYEMFSIQKLMPKLVY